LQLIIVFGKHPFNHFLSSIFTKCFILFYSKIIVWKFNFLTLNISKAELLCRWNQFLIWSSLSSLHVKCKLWYIAKAFVLGWVLKLKLLASHWWKFQDLLISIQCNAIKTFIFLVRQLIIRKIWSIFSTTLETKTSNYLTSMLIRQNFLLRRNMGSLIDVVLLVLYSIVKAGPSYLKLSN